MNTVGSFCLTASQRSAVERTLQDWRAGDKLARLWAKDASLWTGADEAKWLGWLDVIPAQLEKAGLYRQVADQVRIRRFTHVVLLGMGGSSLCPEVLSQSFGRIVGFPRLHVLDSTDPAQVLAVEAKVDLAQTLFIVSSKSGSTLEPDILKQYFFERAGGDGSRFVAITDPQSDLQRAAEAGGFERVYFGVPSIGGRYSALSDFGMVPAAAMGIDVERFLRTAGDMAAACSPGQPLESNPGVMLGAALGALALEGRNKLTIVASPGIQDLGAWLEQLVAESTGKRGQGIIPVDLEALGPPEIYGADRVFVYERLSQAPDAAQDRDIAALEAAGHPVIRIGVAGPDHLGAEFFRWEIATAVAGAVLGINPFDQPDVEASKAATRKLTGQFEQTGSLPAETPAFEEEGVQVYGAASGRTLAECLRAHLGSIRTGDYFALLAYLEMNAANQAALQAIRTRVRDAKGVATCLGFGPRFLHSTGQVYKGGPNTGVFLQVTSADATDVPVPGRSYTFGIVKAAQARGDLEVLVERKRRALRVHLRSGVTAGLDVLRSKIDRAIG